ncbi:MULTISPECIES: Z-ring formation inhibitor MciZ [unclassified Paenibacillus]|nr:MULTISPECIES: Z-ring formation inhibitor MciZ [unclassified Paenibacillus]NWL87375.1 Z-ring formation inhibitor MciZ [Paenibacillus sp. 79R4]
MKSYFSKKSVRVQGKAWQVRIMLNQWQKEAGKSAKVRDFIRTRANK